jgi:predicted RNA-binding protein associated with RNAse of E/G family
MPQHLGALIDAANGTVRGRRGQIHRTDALEIAHGCLYCSVSYPDNPRVTRHERWLLPREQWVINRFTVKRPDLDFREDWYLELDAISIDGDSWRVEDRLLDLGVWEGVRYEVQDVDELVEEMERGLLAIDVGLGVLRAFHRLCKELEKNGFSVDTLLRDFAPGLPR